jgi:hypothetical protein
MPNSLPPSSLCTHEPILTPERKLWRAVLKQVHADSELPLFADGSEPMERVVARRLLRAASDEEAEILRRLCDFADVPADRVILWARKRYPAEHALEHPMECAAKLPLFTAEPV